ncbi:MAG: MmgE/PrpD family protein [Burkholderiales bacterium]|nr:MmgE/PrpD family protein [Burkholderiales bacterium]
MGNAGATSAIAEFACSVTIDALPESVITKTKQLVLDCLGNQIGAFDEEPARMLHDVLDVRSARGKSTVVGYGNCTTPLLAGCLNGMLAHLLDMDDAHRDALTKTGSAVTPAAMAVAEARGCGGDRVIEAVVAGYEVMIRLGLAVNPGHRSRGFHSTATLGAFGAAAAAGRLLDLPRERMIDALGIAATQAAGLTAFINNESMIKPFNVAKSVHNGILAALLAEKGFRGPPAVIEGQEGFIQAYTDRADPAEIGSGIGERFRLLESGFKPHAACRYAHGPIDAAIGLMKKYEFPVDEIDRIDVYLSELANRQSNFYEPKSIASAQGSTPFAIAVGLVSGANSLTVSCIKSAFREERVWGLHRRIRLHVDGEMDYMGRGCRLQVHLRDGRCLEERVDLPRGEPENPMPDREIEQKFMRQASATIGERRAAMIRDMIGRLETVPAVSSIMELTAARNTPGRRRSSGRKAAKRVQDTA